MNYWTEIKLILYVLAFIQAVRLFVEWNRNTMLQEQHEWRKKQDLEKIRREFERKHQR